MIKALAQFERTLISADSKYDRVIWQRPGRYLELRGRYSDAAVMLRQVNSDYDRLMTVRTGTRIPGGGRSLTTITSDPQAREADLLAAERRLERGHGRARP